jgi:hypothetical protein
MVTVATVDLLKLPYASRQLIVVAEDTVVFAARQAEADARAKGKPFDYSDIASAVLRALTGGIFGVTFDAARLLVEGWARARSEGIPVLQVGISEAATITFPPGHPRDRVLYVGHPATSTIYYPMAEFHRVAFEHKFAEAALLLTSLGATRMRVECVKGRTLDTSVHASASSPYGAEVGCEAGVKQEGSQSAMYEATLRGVEQPSIPKDLVWYPHEATWQMVARSRLEAGLKNFLLEVRYEDDYGVHAGLKAQASKAGLEVGGRFSDHEATVWKITGTFKEE